MPRRECGSACISRRCRQVKLCKVGRGGGSGDPFRGDRGAWAVERSAPTHADPMHPPAAPALTQSCGRAGTRESVRRRSPAERRSRPRGYQPPGVQSLTDRSGRRSAHDRKLATSVFIFCCLPAGRDGYGRRRGTGDFDRGGCVARSLPRRAAGIPRRANVAARRRARCHFRRQAFGSAAGKCEDEDGLGRMVHASTIRLIGSRVGPPSAPRAGHRAVTNMYDCRDI